MTFCAIFDMSRFYIEIFTFLIQFAYNKKLHFQFKNGFAFVIIEDCPESSDAY